MENGINMRQIFIDGHVHFYDNFDPDTFVNSIMDNFLKFCNPNETGFSNAVKMIFLTESKDNDFFSRIENNSLPFKNKDIHSEKTGEKGVILLKKNGDPLFYAVRGRQIITEENIEILSVGPGPRVKDNLPAAEVLDILRERDEIAILAWGVGKWLFKRGKVVKKLIRNSKYPLLLIGDNSARPSLWIKPLIYRSAEKNGFKIINGSDPLPIEGEAERAGSYSFIINGKFDPEKPLQSIKGLFRSEIKELHFAGKRDSLFNFLKRQSKILLKKYM